MTAEAEALPFRIHVLRRLNPAITCLLKSPIHGVASKRLLVLQYRGRKSGRHYTIPLVYVSLSGRTYCVTRNTQWWRNAVSAPTVTMWLRGLRVEARAERVATTSAEARAAFSQFLTENPGTASLLYGVRVDAHGDPDGGDIDREIHNSNIIRLTAAGASAAS